MSSEQTTHHSPSNEPLTDQAEDGEDVEYYGPGTVGSQTFTFDFDTGSSDTFVPGPSCTKAQGCPSTTKYNQGGTDQGNTTTITYGSGKVSGENYYDDVTIAGLTATRQNVISLTQAVGFDTSDSNSLMGMAFQEIAESGQPPYFKTLIDQGQVSTPEFSFYLGRASAGTGNNSEMTLGGRDSSKYSGSFTTVPVSKRGYWQIPVDDVVVNNFIDPLDMIATAGQAAIDTGTTLALAPLIAATAIFLRVPGAFPVPLELINGALEPILYFYPCNSNPKIEFVFGGQKFAIAPEDLNFGSVTGDFADIVGNNTLATFLDAGEYCIAGVAADDLRPAENFYVVGDVFLKNWYSTYSYDGPSVSFAKAV